MTRCNVIVIGASAGGVEALLRLVSGLPGELDAAVAIALHIPENSQSALPAILSRHSALEIRPAIDGESLLHKRIYVAPSGRHLLVKRRTIRLVNGPHENGHRPAIDPLFRTAARAHRHRVMGVILSGALDDGTAGLITIKEFGGAALVQDPTEALFDGMPNSALENVAVDFVGTIDGIAEELVRRVELLASSDVEELVMEESAEELDAVEIGRGRPDPDSWNAPPSQFTCPECHGSLWEMRDGAMARYRCRTGHAYSPETLSAHQERSIEAAMFMAFRALEEHASLLRKLHQDALRRGAEGSAKRFLARAEDIESRANVIREALSRVDVADVA